MARKPKKSGLTLVRYHFERKQELQKQAQDFYKETLEPLESLIQQEGQELEEKLKTHKVKPETWKIITETKKKIKRAEADKFREPLQKHLKEYLKEVADTIGDEPLKEIEAIVSKIAELKTEFESAQKVGQKLSDKIQAEENGRVKAFQEHVADKYSYIGNLCQLKRGVVKDALFPGDPKTAIMAQYVDRPWQVPNGQVGIIAGWKGIYVRAVPMDEAGTITIDALAYCNSGQASPFMLPIEWLEEHRSVAEGRQRQKERMAAANVAKETQDKAGNAVTDEPPKHLKAVKLPAKKDAEAVKETTVDKE